MKTIVLGISIYHSYKTAKRLLRQIRGNGIAVENERRYILDMEDGEQYDILIKESRHSYPWEARNQIIGRPEAPRIPERTDFFALLDGDNYLHLAELLALVNANLDIIGAPYSNLDCPHKLLAWDTNIFGQPKNSYPVETRGTREVGALGTGCLVIKRRVFETMAYPWFYNPKDDNPDPDKTNALRDSYQFGLHARRAGFKIHCNFDLRAEHDQITREKINWSWDEL